MRTRSVWNPRYHPRAEVACPPLGWRAVGRRVVFALVAGALSGWGAIYIAWRWRQTGDSAAALTAASLAGACTASVLWLTHLLNAARTPVTFRIADGELVVVKPFLFLRRRRRLKASEVRAVTVSTDRDVSDGRLPTGRLSIRRRYRLSLRVPGRRPLHELDRVAEELRTVLRV